MRTPQKGNRMIALFAFKRSGKVIFFGLHFFIGTIIYPLTDLWC